MTLGLIADTHDYFDPRIGELFSGVDHILHAGDICSWPVLNRLEQIAPVTAVLGNNDHGLDLRETEIAELGGKRFLLHHILVPAALTPTVQRRVASARPEVIVFGHSHRRFHEKLDGILFVNPGYAGKRRFDLRRSVALLQIETEGVRVEFHEL